MIKYILGSRVRALVIVISASMAIFALTGQSVFASPEMLAAGLMLPFVVGDTSDTGGLTQLLKDQGHAFEEFKSANDARLKAIEEKGYAPADIVEKVDHINAELSKLTKDINEIAKKSNRPQTSTETKGLTPDQMEYKTAFQKFIRKGDANGLSELERKAFQRGSDVDGGYLIHPEMETEIDRVASTVSNMRMLADVRTIGKTSLQFRVKKSGLAARWVGENESGGETTGAQYAQIEIYAEEMEIEPWAYNTALEDADFDIEADVVDEAGIGFGEAEGAGFITGTGVKQPNGILNYTKAANANYAWGKVGFITSGASGAFASSNPGDKVIDLIHSLKSTYRVGATLMMADTTLGSLRQIKDGAGSFYLFQPDATGEFSGFVLGVPVVIDDNMPVMEANSYSIAYANFNRAYRIVDRRGIALIRDNITTKGTTKFNFRKRVGGGIKNFEAIKLMKFA
ncbi:phage major capsid protein, HK97 family [Nitrosomonas aestuarii]|uniref:Phage major capsid protein, HK97 family n=1 Tax=Nitrosomonas aestuarii TaxID=52441 RepID=A0A1I4C0V7_9PROT|nr:phage major capsid protein [Nitrosomonas aestuarii]SFK74708.1 phage major capsid protein, HK97 family [Nitrosomonas aestuarii]